MEGRQLSFAEYWLPYVGPMTHLAVALAINSAVTAAVLWVMAWRL